MPKSIFLFAITVLFCCSATGHEAPIRDLDGDGIPNISDRDVDNDGIPNKSDRNVDGGLCKKGPFKGKYIGDRLKNDSPKELDIDDDGRKDDAFGEKDIDGDGIEDQSDSDVDGDGRKNSVDDDVDGDGIKNKKDLNVDGDDYMNADDIDVDGDGLDNDVDPDIDGDGKRNDKDPDQDGDGIKNKKDRDSTGSDNTGSGMIIDTGTPPDVMIPIGEGDFIIFEPIILENKTRLTFRKECVAGSPYILRVSGRDVRMSSPDGNFTLVLDGFEYMITLDQNDQPVLVSVKEIPPVSEETGELQTL